MASPKQVNKDKGETIVEVLLAISVAALSLGTSYAIANRSVQKSISSRERNESSSIAESQISALKLREQNTDTTTFNSLFATSSTIPSNFLHFCLDENATDKTKPNWLPINNNGQVNNSTPLVTSGNPSYAAPVAPSPGCVRTPGPTGYYIDITAMATNYSLTSNPPTVYQVNVRWAAIGTDTINQVSIYYRF